MKCPSCGHTFFYREGFKARLLEKLTESDTCLTLEDLMTAFPQYRRGSISRALTELKSEGLVTNPARGQWSNLVED